MGMREQMSDLKYLISKDNRSSRGFYLMLMIIAILLILGGIAMEVAAIMGLVTGAMRIVGFAFLPVVIIGLIIIMKLLSR